MTLPVMVPGASKMQNVMKGLFRTILDNYRDVAMYDRGLSEIECAIAGISVNSLLYRDERLTFILYTIQEMQKELKELHEQLDKAGGTENSS